jgi:hypothetical protein
MQMRRKVSMVNRLIRAAAQASYLACATGALVGQKIQITSPTDGILVHSGQTLTVTVDADSAAFRYLLVGTCLHMPPPPPLSRPPYVFNIQIPPDASSGMCAVGATGTPKSAGADVWHQVTIDVERADTPQRLIPALSALIFPYAGEKVSLDVIAAFADGSRVLATHSTYIAFSSDTPGVATVDEQGAVTAVAPGEAKIGIAYRNVLIHVPVYVPVPIAVNPSTVSLYPLETSKFSPILSMDPNLDQSVVWSIEPAIGRIDQTGLYTAPSSVAARQGVTVTATSVADPMKSASARIWLRPRPGNI